MGVVRVGFGHFSQLIFVSYFKGEEDFSEETLALSQDWIYHVVGFQAHGLTQHSQWAKYLLLEGGQVSRVEGLCVGDFKFALLTGMF